MCRVFALLLVVAACRGSNDFAIVGAASPAFTQITALPTEIKADGMSTSTITVRAKDMNNNGLREGGDVVVLETTLGTLDPIRDSANGTYTTILRSGTTNGTARVSGIINGGKITSGDAIIMFLP